MMVEGGGNEITEDDLLGAVAFAHAEIKKIVAAIDKLAKKVGKPKRDYPASAKRPKRSKPGSRKTSRRTSPRRCASSRRASATTAFAKLSRSEALARLTKKDDAIRALLEDSDQ